MTATADDGDLELAATEVYRADPADFVTTRDRHVRELKAADRRQLADQVASLRKPTLPAWAVNQVALQDRELLDAALEAGEAARSAQGGDDRDVRQAARRELRDKVATARDRAAEHLQRIGADPAGHLEEIEQTLTAAAVDPEARDHVTAGRLTKPLDPPGFGAIAGVTIGERDRRPRSAPPTEDDEAPRRRERLREMRGDLHRLERRRARAQSAVQRTEERAERLRQEADEAASAAEDSREELARIDDEVAKLREELEGLNGSA